MFTDEKQINPLVTGHLCAPSLYISLRMKLVMEQKDVLVVFNGKKIRRIWHYEEWYFSVIDIVAVLTEQSDFQTARKYWNKLSQRLKEEGSEVVTNCHQLKLPKHGLEKQYLNISSSRILKKKISEII